MTDTSEALQQGGDLDQDGDEGGGLRLHVTLEEKLAVAQDVTTQLFALLGAGQPGVQCHLEDDQVVVRLIDLNVELVPAGDTRVLESLQFILNKAINRFALKRTRLSIDADGFRRRRPEGLDKVAQALAQKVIALDRPIAIGPLGQGDLRFISGQLSRTPGIVFQTTGAADKRRLVIAPGRFAVQGSENKSNDSDAPRNTAPDESAEGEGDAEGARRRRRRRR